MEVWLNVGGRQEPSLPTVDSLRKAWPVCVEGHARAWPRDAEGECGGVAGEGVGRGGVLLQEVGPLLVVVIPEHVERLVAEGVNALRPCVLVRVLLEGHLDLVVAEA